MIHLLYKRAYLRFYIVLPLLILCLFNTKAKAQDSSQALNLHQAITRTLAQNPQLHQFSLKKEALVGRRTSSELKPKMRLSIDLENFGGSGNRKGFDSAETTLALSSIIEFGSKRNARISLVDAKLNVLEYRKQAFTLDVLAELTRLFVKTLELQELSELALEARDLAQNTLDIVQNRSSKGAAAESDLKRAKASVAQAQLQLDALVAQGERNRMRLAGYWAETSPKWLTLTGSLYATGTQAEFTTLYQRALSSPAIEVFASEARLKTAEVQLAKTQSKADLHWQLGLQRFEDSGDSAFTAGMSIPLFSGKRAKGNIAAAMANRNEVEYKRKSALLRLHAQLYEAFSQRKQHVHAIEVFKSTIIPELAAALKSTQHAYETGRYSYQDWIAAQQELLKAKHNLIESAAAAALNQAVIEQLVAQALTP